jgi:hypothetical protein
MGATTIDWLNALLCDELAAVETYVEALDGRGSLPAGTELRQCQRSHEVRVRMLRDKIASLGGTPTTACGLRDVWGTPDAGEIGDDVAVRALQVGEDRILYDYHASIPRLERDVRWFVEHNLLPAEEYTQSTLSALTDR